MSYNLFLFNLYGAHFEMMSICIVLCYQLIFYILNRLCISLNLLIFHCRLQNKLFLNQCQVKYYLILLLTSNGIIHYTTNLKPCKGNSNNLITLKLNSVKLLIHDHNVMQFRQVQVTIRDTGP